MIMAARFYSPLPCLAEVNPEPPHRVLINIRHRRAGRVCIVHPITLWVAWGCESEGSAYLAYPEAYPEARISITGGGNCWDEVGQAVLEVMVIFVKNRVQVRNRDQACPYLQQRAGNFWRVT